MTTKVALLASYYYINANYRNLGKIRVKKFREINIQVKFFS